MGGGQLRLSRASSRASAVELREGSMERRRRRGWASMVKKAGSRSGRKEGRGRGRGWFGLVELKKVVVGRKGGRKQDL